MHDLPEQKKTTPSDLDLLDENTFKDAREGATAGSPVESQTEATVVVQTEATDEPQVDSTMEAPLEAQAESSLETPLESTVEAQIESILETQSETKTEALTESTVEASADELEPTPPIEEGFATSRQRPVAQRVAKESSSRQRSTGRKSTKQKASEQKSILFALNEMGTSTKLALGGLGVMLLIAVFFLFQTLSGGNGSKVDKKIPLQVQSGWTYPGVIGKRFYYVENGVLFAVDAQGREVFRYQTPDLMTDIVYGEYIYISDTTDQVWILDPASAEVVKEVQVPGLSKMQTRAGSLIALKNDAVMRYDKKMETFTYYHTGMPATQFATNKEGTHSSVLVKEQIEVATETGTDQASDEANTGNTNTDASQTQSDSTQAQAPRYRSGFLVFDGTEEGAKLTSTTEPFLSIGYLDESKHALLTTDGIYVYEKDKLLQKIPTFDRKAFDVGRGKIAYVDGMQVIVVSADGQATATYQIDFTATDIMIFENQILVLGDTTAAVVQDGKITAQKIPQALYKYRADDAYYLVFGDGVERVTTE